MQRNEFSSNMIAIGLVVLFGMPAAATAQLVLNQTSFPRTDGLSQTVSELGRGNPVTGVPGDGAGPTYKPGDADRDFDFDQYDLVQVIRARKYKTGLPATWGEGDWNVSAAGFPPVMAYLISTT